MVPKRILVPLAANTAHLKGLHYALSLADRIEAHVYVLQQDAGTGIGQPRSLWLQEALLDLINTARQAGVPISHYVSRGEMKDELIHLIQDQGIDLLVFAGEEVDSEEIIHHLKPLIQPQIIQVKEKDTINYLQED